MATNDEIEILDTNIHWIKLFIFLKTSKKNITDMEYIKTYECWQNVIKWAWMVWSPKKENALLDTSTHFAKCTDMGP